MSAGFINGIVQTNLTGLVYANGTSAHASSLVYTTNIFTPTIIGSTTAGTTTYTAQYGQFTQIGNRVFFDVFVSFTETTGTGDIQVSDFPFTINDSTSESFTIAVTSGIAWPNNQGTYLAGRCVNSTTSAVIVCHHETNAPANVQMPSGTGTYTINLSGSYQAEET